MTMEFSTVSRDTIPETLFKRRGRSGSKYEALFAAIKNLSEGEVLHITNLDVAGSSLRQAVSGATGEGKPLSGVKVKIALGAEDSKEAWVQRVAAQQNGKAEDTVAQTPATAGVDRSQRRS